MVVQLGHFSDPFPGERIRKRCDGMPAGAVLMAVQDVHFLPGVRSVPPHLPTTDPPPAGLHKSLHTGIRRRLHADRAPEDTEAPADHKPPLPLFHTALPLLRHGQSVRLAAQNHQVPRRCQYLQGR